jgi:hypothetical protein
MKTFGALLAILTLTACGPVRRPGPMLHETASFNLDQSEVTRVELKMAVGEIRVEGGSPKLAEADFNYNVAEWKPKVDYRSSGSRADLSIRQPEASGNGVGDTENKWDIRLNNDAAIDLVAKLGVGSSKLRLGTLNLRSVELSMGVGEAEVDLRGKPRRSYDVRIEGGVGEATVYVPKDVGIEATADGGIGEIDVEGLEKRGDRWINSSQEHSNVTIHLRVKGGVGEIKIVAE